MAPPSRTQIRVNALSRLIKEHQLYQKELKEQNKAVKEHKGDAYELKKLQQIHKETENILPRVKTRIEEELKALKQIKPEAEIQAKYEQSVQAAESYLASL